MSFAKIIEQYESANFDLTSVTDADALRALSVAKLTPQDFLTLLSGAARAHIEQMATRAHNITRAQFGYSMHLFTPLYVSNICDNLCPYCSFAHQHKITRRHLSIDEVEREAKNIAAQDIRHILLLTGESRKAAPLSYLEECVTVLKKYFSAISIEVYPLTESEYAQLVNAGATGLTIYQETYDKNIYTNLHVGGPKVDFDFRLAAPERGATAGMRAVTVGPLLGLAPPVRDVFLAGLHAKYLQDNFPSLEVSVSLPRLRPLAGEFDVEFNITDAEFVQYMTALRIFLPTAGITVSTRENKNLRNSILKLGPTKMSAGVNTSVGASCGESSEPQFEIADERSVQDMRRDLLSHGFQPVMVDWNHSM